MRYLLIPFLFLFSTSATAVVEIWECYYSDGSVEGIYKLNTDEPSVAESENGKWAYWKKIVYDKENQNLNNRGRDTFDLALKKWITKVGISVKFTYDCNVISP